MQYGLTPKVDIPLKIYAVEKGIKYWADLATSVQGQLWCSQTPFVSLPCLGITRWLVTTGDGERAKFAFILSVGAWESHSVLSRFGVLLAAFSLIPSLCAWQAVWVCIGVKFSFIWGFWFNFYLFLAYHTVCLASVLGSHQWWDVEVGESGTLSASG